MNQYKLKIQARKKMDILERIIRTIRHRGGSINQMDMCQEGQGICLNLEVESIRPVNIFLTQLAKLIDVETVHHLNED